MSELSNLTRVQSVPVGPMLSIFDPVYVGIDEIGRPVYVPIVFRNLLIGGEPGAGKSSMLNNFVAHAALCPNTRLCLIDGKQVELGLWAAIADAFVGPDAKHAIETLRRLQQVMDNRYAFLRAHKRRKISRAA